MARKIDEIRERRFKDELSAEKNVAPATAPAPKKEAPAKKGSKWNPLNLFRRKPKEDSTDSKNSKKKDSKKGKKKRILSDSGHFKIIPFIFYIVIFLACIAVLVIYIVDRESQYETKNKKLFTVATKPSAQDESQNAAPIIEAAPIIAEDTTAPAAAPTVVVTPVMQDTATFRLVDVTPKNLGNTKLTFADFLTFIGSNRSDFCRYAETARMAFILANGEIRDYSNATMPVKSKLVDYSNCMNPSIWAETELFNLYNNLYDDFLATNTQDDSLLRKLNAAKNFSLRTNFNVVRDMPEVFKARFLSESEFISIFRGDYTNQVLFCNYSNMFAKAYDQFISKRVGSLKPVSNCLLDIVNNQEAYTQYVFYFNYIQPNPTDPNIIALQNGLIPNE
ncbi:MAG: hypothetical protein LBQ34_02895 [Alphaproteobacteria bacterium]|jgi:flagellar basal body-associated protein FliL|nr:hypothetical protein [Alphaproteobacteria bacterium]